MSMSENQPAQAISVQIANEIVNIANSKLESGIDASEIAAGLRHAAANFSAFALYQTTSDLDDAKKSVEEFVRYFEYYLERHQPADQPQGGLYKLIEDAKNEI